MISLRSWQWMHERPWVAGLASCVLHLGVAGVASIALLRPPEFGMESGTGGAGGVRSEREISAEVELEVMPPKENVVETVPESGPLPVEPEAEIVLPSAPAVEVPVPVKPAASEKKSATGMARVAAPDRGTGSGGIRTEATADHFRNRPPAYPESARRKRQEGVVELFMEVTSQGRVSSVKIYKSSGYPVLDQAALNAARRYRFKPATIGGIPVDSTTIQPIRFDLKDRT
jgi:periplasmic protein TonB